MSCKSLANKKIPFSLHRCHFMYIVEQERMKS